MNSIVTALLVRLWLLLVVLRFSGAEYRACERARPVRSLARVYGVALDARHVRFAVRVQVVAMLR